MQIPAGCVPTDELQKSFSNMERIIDIFQKIRFTVAQGLECAFSLSGHILFGQVECLNFLGGERTSTGGGRVYGERYSKVV